MSKQKKLVVIGGGAAGFFCAVTAARLAPGLKVLIVERSNKYLSKVRVSGGGRCNVTNSCDDITEMSSRYPRGSHFVRKAFHQFFTTDTIEWFQKRGVPLKAEPDGRMFPVSNTSESIVNCLVKEANQYGVELLPGREVTDIREVNNSAVVVLKDGQELLADFIVVACGGFPKAEQFGFLRSTGHTIVPPVPSLFTFNIPDPKLTALMGVSLPSVTIKIQGSKLKQTGPLLITHWGLSGPSVLRLSAWGATELAEKQYRFQIVVNWLNEMKEEEVKQLMQSIRTANGSQKVTNQNPFRFPTRFWDYLVSEAEINAETRWADLSAKTQNKLIQLLTAQVFTVNGKTTFKEEFVTAGGVSLKEIDVNTMQSKRMNHLYFAGEIMDVDGITGGYNFQHAWTSGYIAASAIAKAAAE
ncbi:MAG: NAD(P)/FAD-dependent oxidoreductase [Chitinophagaceae bacterium]